ncbi:MAG: TnpV protein [Clostridia bacterium]|nr:TnpV protein [Clostridia bacterium]
MKENLKDIGILGRRHYDYLKANKPTVINVMRMNGTLNSYLKDVNEQAEEMLSQLIKQMAKSEGVTEELKRKDQMAWVGAMNNIRDRATETVNNELIFE